MSAEARRAVSTGAAPPPAGPYSQAVVVGKLVFLAGQTPREPGGCRLLMEPLHVQVRQTLDNLDAVAAAAGGSLRDAVKINIFVRPGVDMAIVNEIYREYVADPLPARTTTVSELPGGAIEIDAILHLGTARASGKGAFR